MQSYIRYLQGLCSGAIKSGEPSELDKRLLEAKVLERESKARQAKYRADAMEQDLIDRRLSKEIQKLPSQFLQDVSYFIHDENEFKIIAAKLKVLVDKILNGAESP